MREDVKYGQQTAQMKREHLNIGITQLPDLLIPGRKSARTNIVSDKWSAHSCSLKKSNVR